MKLKAIIEEDFVNYKKPSMLLATCYCDWKCLTEKNLDIHICQNSELALQKNIEVSVDEIIERYLDNPITNAVVIAGLEPMKQFDEVYEFIEAFRQKINDDIVIYTGYYPEEIQDKINKLKKFNNIIMKYGRYEPNKPKRYDEVLGIWLISDNQYAEVL